MQTVKLVMEIKLASLGHVSLDGSKFKANSSSHKAMNYKFLKEKEQAICVEVEALLQHAKACDAEHNAAYQERIGYELPADLTFKQRRRDALGPFHDPSFPTAIQGERRIAGQHASHLPDELQGRTVLDAIQARLPGMTR